LIDVGPLVAQHQGDGVQRDSAVGWSQVLSPGAFLTLSPVCDAPWVWGLGIAKTPKLIKTTNGGEVTSTRYITTFIAIDVTILGF
jgi:hypothetical protein